MRALIGSLLITLALSHAASAPLPARAGGMPTGQTADAARRVVSPDGPYPTIQQALAASQDGDVIEVRPGTYRGPIVVERSVTLEGVGRPVIDGGGEGTVVTLAAPGATLRGFEVRGSGVEPDRDHAGVTLTAPRTVVEDNHLRDVLFGVFVAQAGDAVVRGNDITSKTEYDEGRKGDAIRLWYSPRVVVAENHVHGARDVVIWYSTDVTIQDNLIERGRYGVHLMYTDGARIERNRILRNSVGIYTMYSKDIVLRDNDVRGQRGPSGYALGFKDSDAVIVTGNLLVDNRVGVFIDGTPFTNDGFGRFHDNILAFNDVGLVLLPAVRGNTFERNTFWENVEQAATQGQHTGAANTWCGNFWSDYAGFDADGDGVGDLPYRAERLFENMIDRVPGLRALIYSPAAQTVEFAASAFPIVRPQPKLEDAAPIMQPAILPVAPDAGSHRAPFALAAASLIGLALACAGVGSRRGESAGGESVTRPYRWGNVAAPGPHTSPQGDAMTVHATQLTKRYGKVLALNEVSFALKAGQSTALWGPNGAGKTTLIKAILGLIDYQGSVTVEGMDTRRNGKRVRSLIGYVPQEAVFYDWSVQATMTFYAQLKKADPAAIPALLARLGLTEHAGKPVPALSGGLKQRLALAVALLGEPRILLLDEPMANLDARAGRLSGSAFDASARRQDAHLRLAPRGRGRGAGRRGDGDRGRAIDACAIARRIARQRQPGDRSGHVGAGRDAPGCLARAGRGRHHGATERARHRGGAHPRRPERATGQRADLARHSGDRFRSRVALAGAAARCRQG